MEAVLLKFIDFILDKNSFLVYAFFFVSSFLQVSFPPWPGDTLLIFQGYMLSKTTEYNIISIILNAWIATSLSLVLFYWLGYTKGELVFKYKLVNRYIPQKSRDKATQVFTKYGSFAIIASKFIPGINTVMILFSGIFKVKPYIAVASIFFASFMHNTIYILLGKFLGYNMEYLKRVISSYNSAVIILVIVSIAGYFIYNKFYRRQRS